MKDSLVSLSDTCAIVTFLDLTETVDQRGNPFKDGEDVVQLIAQRLCAAKIWAIDRDSSVLVYRGHWVRENAQVAPFFSTVGKCSRHRQCLFIMIVLKMK